MTFKFDVGQHGGYVNAGLYDDGSPGELFITMDKEGSIVAGLMDALATSCSIGMQYGVPLEAFVRKFAFTAYEPNGFTGDPDVPRAHSLVDYIFRKLGILFVPGYREEMQGGPGSPQKPSDPRAALVVDMARAGLATGQPGPPSDLVLAMEPYAAQAPWKTFEIRPLTAGDLNHLERQADLVQARVGEPPVRESSVDRLVRVFGLPDRTAKHAPKTVTAEHGPPCDTCGHLMVRCGACYRCENCGSQGGCG